VPHTAVRSQAFRVVYDRPAMSREACQQIARPCKYILCPHHLGTEINTRNGMGFTIDEEGPLVRYPIQADGHITSCALDVAERGGATLEEIAAILSITRERVRQVEERALGRLKKHGDDLESLTPSFSPAAAVVA